MGGRGGAGKHGSRNSFVSFDTVQQMRNTDVVSEVIILDEKRLSQVGPKDDTSAPTNLGRNFPYLILCLDGWLACAILRGEKCEGYTFCNGYEEDSFT